MTDFPQRKKNRLECFDYNTNGVYFVTICTQERRKILSKIVGAGLPACPQIKCELLPHGQIADKWINQMNEFYEYLSVERYVIMPDHIHLLILVSGQAGRPVPTKIEQRNTKISKFVGSFKRFCNREYGENIWQRSYYDHVIRNQRDYDEIWQYIENNPAKWIMERM